MYRKILVPVDGSATSTLGLEQAIGLAKDQNARVRVLNVIDEHVIASAVDPYMPGDAAMLLELIEKTGNKALAKAAALTKAAKITGEIAQVRGGGRYVSDVILDDAKRWRADLIVMGTHGRRGLNRLLLGSDAERVLREAPVPVLLVRKGQRERSRKRRTSSGAREKSPS